MNLLKQWYKSLYSPRDIARLRFQSIGKTIFYLFFLSLISIIPPSIYNSIEISHALKSVDELAESTLPDFKIEHGKLFTSIERAEKYKNLDTTILFDPTGIWSSENLEEYGRSFGFFSNEFAYHSNGKTKTLPYDILGEFSLTKDTLMKYLHTINGILPIILFLIILTTFLFVASLKFIEISILSFFGLILSRLIANQIPYRRLWVVSAFSITLAVTFSTIMSALSITIISSYFFYWLISIIMLFLTLREVPIRK